MRRLSTVLCWLLVVPGAAWAVVRLLGLERGPLVQGIAFTPYAAAWSLLPAVLALALRRWSAAVAAVLVAAVLIGAVAPRAVPDRAPGADGPRLRVLTANLRAGAADPATLVDLVRRERVDVLALQEYTPAAEAALAGLGLAADLPHRVTNPVPGTPGSALYARLPVRDPGVRRNAGGFTQAYATVAVPGAAPLLVESVHPAAPYALGVLDDWRADLAAQPAAAQPGPVQDGPVQDGSIQDGPVRDGPIRVLAGDFNATLDHALLRRLLATGYRDAAATVGAGLAGTWPACARSWGSLRSFLAGRVDALPCRPVPPVVIDHVLADRRVGIVAVSVHRLPGSDHRAVLAVLSLPGPS